MPTNIWRVGVRRMGPSSFQWCPVTGQGVMGTNWGTWSSVWTWGGTSSLWGWRSTGTGCPGRLWSLLLWRYSRPAWTWSCAACCRWPCFGRRVGLDDPQRSLPTPTILWFCDSASKHSMGGIWLCPFYTFFQHPPCRFYTHKHTYVPMIHRIYLVLMLQKYCSSGSQHSSHCISDTSNFVFCLHRPPQSGSGPDALH